MEATATQTAIGDVKRNFDFTVNKFPLSGPDNMKTPFYGMFRSDTSENVGGTVKRGYVPHQSEDVVALTEAAAAAFDDNIRVGCHFKNGHYVNICPSDETRKSIFGKNDNIFPRVIIRAGYDGQAFSATMGYYRDLCRNLAMMRSVKSTCVRVRHSSNLRTKMDDLIQTFSTVRESWADLYTVIGELETRPVKIAEFMDQIYGQPDPNSKRGVTVHRKRTEAIVNRIMRERYESNRQTVISGEVSAWEAWNGIQGYVQHDATRQKATPFDRVLLANGDPNVKKAEQIVMALVS